MYDLIWWGDEGRGLMSARRGKPSSSRNRWGVKSAKRMQPNQRCRFCGDVVYHAEQLRAAGGLFHRECFVCAAPSCGRRLDSRSYNEHLKKLYCNFCYKDRFGPSGIGFGGLCISKQLPERCPVNGGDQSQHLYTTQRIYSQNIPTEGNTASSRRFQYR